jgi:ubiquinone/menaquinone biosynthesis C-methylase UbiE
LNKKLEFWNSRAQLPAHTGWDDFISKDLEQEFLLNNLPARSHILDIGCGDGETLLKVCKEKGSTGIGIDFSSQMIERAQKNVQKTDGVQFLEASVLDLPKTLPLFDAIYSERCLINLDSFAEQKAALEGICRLLKKDGVFIMIEATNDGLNKVNEFRKILDLSEIATPWHNLYFNIEDVAQLQKPDFRIEKLEHISSTYYFLSRVVYAKLQADKNESVCYDSPINLLARKLPQNLGEFGPVKAWVWRKL